MASGGSVAPDRGQRVPALVDHLLHLSGRPGPRLCFINTGEGDSLRWVEPACVAFQGSPVVARHLALFPMPNVADPEDLLLSQDVIFVGGGSTANMVAVWRVHGLDQVLRRAWEQGVVLAGVSAGAICWFAGGTTDSFGPELRPFADGLGLLAGSYCPHYDSEPRRRPAFQALVADRTLPGGIGCDDGAAAHFVDDGLVEVLVERPGPRGYRVEPVGSGGCRETPLAIRRLES